MNTHACRLRAYPANQLDDYGFTAGQYDDMGIPVYCFDTPNPGGSPAYFPDHSIDIAHNALDQTVYRIGAITITEQTPSNLITTYWEDSVSEY